MQRFLFLSVSLALVLAFAGPGQADSVVQDGADFLANQQRTDSEDASGGFPWVVDGTVYSNVQGPAGAAMISAHEITNDSAHLQSAIDNADYIMNKYPDAGGTWDDGSINFASHDLYFLERMSEVTGDPTYSNYAETHYWSELRNGTYGPGWDAQQEVQDNVDARTDNKATLPAYDQSRNAVAAHMAGESNTISTIMSNGVEQGLNDSDSTATYEDITSLGGAVWASAATGYELDPTSGKFSSADSTAELASMLAGYQQSNGAWLRSTETGATVDTQATALAMLALREFDSDMYQSELQGGLDFLRDIQQTSGLFPEVNSSTDYTFNHAEALDAYATTVPLPTSAWAGLALLGGLGAYTFCRRQRHSARVT